MWNERSKFGSSIQTGRASASGGGSPLFPDAGVPSLLAPPAFARAASYEASGASGRTESVSEIDNLFDPSTPHVAVGSTVGWTNDGRSPHTVTADDGSFDSGNQAPGAAFTFT